MKLDFLKLPSDERRLYIEQAAIQRNINLIEPLPSLGEALIKKKGEELFQSVTKILNKGANAKHHDMYQKIP